MRQKELWLLTGLLFLITVLPAFLLLWGLFLNNAFGCNISDSSGLAHGDCSSVQYALVRNLLSALWFMNITIPLCGIPFLFAFSVGVVTLLKKKHISWHTNTSH